jgi:hypothetical protein
MSRGREAAVYLGYVTLFAAVVVWGFVTHAPKPAHDGAAGLQLAHDGADKPHLRSGGAPDIRRVTASMVR